MGSKPLMSSERRVLLGVGAAVVALHLIGWGLLFGVIVRGHSGTATIPIGAGIGITAYVLGLRHAFDADHIAAIDNVTRQLMRRRKARPVAVGFFFSAGHSTVVLAIALLVAFGVRGLVGSLMTEGSPLRQATTIIGAGVSGSFLLVVAAINVVALVALVRRSRPGVSDADGPPGGMLSRALRRPLRLVSRPRHMYLVGFLFGLGFDTATEVGLLVIAVTSVAAGVPWYGVLCLPILFAAGMTLFDSLDGIFVCFAYGWAMAGTSRRLRYNLVVTVASIVAAVGIGAIEIVAAISAGLSWRGVVPEAIASIDLNFLGAVVLISLGLIFLTVLVIRRTSRFERAPMDTALPIESPDASVVEAR